MNLHEEITHSRLRSVCEDYGASIAIKIRIADIMPIERSGISNEEYAFALRSHLDFLVFDSNREPLFAVEFDGPSHQDPSQKRRDAIKNDLCEKFSLPLLRINSKSLQKKFRHMDILSWFIEIWFLAEGFYRAQKQGEIPYEEPFDPFHLSVSDRKMAFPFDLAYDVDSRIRTMYKTGIIRDERRSYFVGTDEEGTYYGISYLKINDDLGVSAESVLRNQNFPSQAEYSGDLQLMLPDLLSAIMANELFEKLLVVQKDEAPPEPWPQMREKVESFRSTYREVSSCYFGHDING